MLDDEAEICRAISAVLSGAGFAVVCYSDPCSFVGSCVEKSPSCILLEAVLPGVSGLDVLREIRNQGCRAPILMMSGSSDIATAVRAIKQGASDFIEKPFRGIELVSRVDAAVEVQRSKAERAMFYFPGRPPLTMREQDVLTQLSAGHSTKEIAARLSLSPRTVESHRAMIIRKVGARNPAELVRLALLATRTPRD